MHPILTIALGVFFGGLPLVFVATGFASWLRDAEHDEAISILFEWLGIGAVIVVVYAIAWFFTRA